MSAYVVRLGLATWSLPLIIEALFDKISFLCSPESTVSVHSANSENVKIGEVSLTFYQPKECRVTSLATRFRAHRGIGQLKYLYVRAFISIVPAFNENHSEQYSHFLKF